MTLLNPINKSFWLANLCEANYRKLKLLIPDLGSIPPGSALMAAGKPSLYLTLLDRSPYTVTVELTHSFKLGFESSLEPAVRIRICLDAGVAEVLSDHERPCVLDALHDRFNLKGIMDYKWSLNYFLSQWLDHCLQSHYRLSLASPDEEYCAPAAC